MSGALRKALSAIAVVVIVAPAFLSCAEAAAPTPGNVLFTGNTTSAGGACFREYTRTGQFVQEIAVPYPDPNATFEPGDVRDLIVDSQGRIHVYHGTFQPYLSTYVPSTNKWYQLTYPQWSTVNNGSYGGIATLGNYVYVTDMFTYNGGEAKGIIRFDLNTGNAQRFTDQLEFIDLTLGQDGLIYGLYPGGSPSGTTIDVYDPITMGLIRTINLPDNVRGNIRSIAVNKNGIIYLNELYGPVYKVSAQGALMAQMGYTVNSYVDDLDLDADGTLMITEFQGTVVFTDENLSSFRTITVFNGSNGFGTFVPAVPEPGSLAALASLLTASAAVIRRKREK